MSSDDSDTRTKILDATWKLMERNRGQGVRMSDIAKATGISRQAVYLHFANRTDLMLATIKYVDDVKGLDERLKALNKARDSVELLEKIIEVWGGYIPEIYGIAKGVMVTRDTDEAHAAAWRGCIDCLRAACRDVIDALRAEKKLAKGWTRDAATEMLLVQLSIQTWEQLTVEEGWSQGSYIKRMKLLLKRALVD